MKIHYDDFVLRRKTNQRLNGAQANAVDNAVDLAVSHTAQTEKQLKQIVNSGFRWSGVR